MIDVEWIRCKIIQFKRVMGAKFFFPLGSRQLRFSIFLGQNEKCFKDLVGFTIIPLNI